MVRPARVCLFLDPAVADISCGGSLVYGRGEDEWVEEGDGVRRRGVRVPLLVLGSSCEMTVRVSGGGRHYGWIRF